MLSGTVKWFNETKGYGFILGSEGGDVFVHYSQIAGGGFRTLHEGEAVEYEAEKGPKGLHAMRVMRRESTS